MGADGEDRHPHVFTLAAQDSARRRGLSVFQTAALLATLLAVAFAVWRAPAALAAAAVLSAQVAFGICAVWRILLAMVSLGRPAPAASPEHLPTYGVLVALHDEAEVASQLVAAMSRIDYPRDRLEGFLLLEAHDQATRTAIEAMDLPDWLSVLVVPPGVPLTKPRALNHGLARTNADLITVYDAEDRPDPQQLREAAARFAADHGGRLACLQAPLRITRAGPSTSPFFDRQFALEYAALFEVTLPALSRLGLPFPLGGTSNHFRASVLREVGGWDAHNVTEDADLGFRLHRHGYRLGVLSRSTLETPPGGLGHWLPQRTRWMKGYMQTWGVHTRRPWRFGARGALSLIMTLGMALASAAVHAPSVAWVSASILVAAAMGLTPAIPQTAVIVLSAGVLCAWLTSAIGARRADLAYGPVEMLEAPAYWSLLSIAFGHAVWRLITEPFSWDKTRHRPDVVVEAGPTPVPRPISGV